MRNLRVLTVALALTASGCTATNSYLTPRTTRVEMYHVFDVRTAAGKEIIAKAAADGLSSNTSEVNINMPLQLRGPIPETPGRFTLVDGSNARAPSGGGLLQLASIQHAARGSKMVECKGAVWTVHAERRVTHSNQLSLDACLYPYQQGFHLNLYAVFDKQEGGIKQLSRDLAFRVVGTPEEWVNKTILDMVRAIRTANAEVIYLEGQPELGAEPALFKKAQ